MFLDIIVIFLNFTNAEKLLTVRSCCSNFHTTQCSFFSSKKNPAFCNIPIYMNYFWPRYLAPMVLKLKRWCSWYFIVYFATKAKKQNWQCEAMFDLFSCSSLHKNRYCFFSDVKNSACFNIQIFMNYFWPDHVIYFSILLRHEQHK